jgi:hypothetical protein
VRRTGATAEAGGVAKAIVEELLGRGAERLIEQGRRSLGAG